ncbi:MAG: antibiotic biosynthesis monooxygenase [Desulfobacteraceae bacterium]|nr:antibiotic biosynthesis monooxygenase [Desulfobacteraceae bacterium]
MNTVSISLKVFRQKRDEFLQTLHSLQSDLKKDQGLIKSALYQDVNDPERFHLINEWETEQDYDNYLRSENFSVLIGALKVLSEETEVRYHMGSPKIDKKVIDA